MGAYYGRYRVSKNLSSFLGPVAAVCAPDVMLNMSNWQTNQSKHRSWRDYISHLALDYFWFPQEEQFRRGWVEGHLAVAVSSALWLTEQRLTTDEFVLLETHPILPGELASECVTPLWMGHIYLFHMRCCTQQVWGLSQWPARGLGTVSTDLKSMSFHSPQSEWWKHTTERPF